MPPRAPAIPALFFLALALAVLAACDEGGAESPADRAEAGPDTSPQAVERTERLTRELPPPTPDTAPAADTLAPGIRGRVTVGEAGLGGVAVQLRTGAGEEVRTRTFQGRSDRRGFFGFDPAGAGTYRVSLELPEASGVGFPDTTRTVDVATPEQLTRVDFRGELQAISTLEGTVHEASGAPVPGARIDVEGEALEGYRAEVALGLGGVPWRGSAVTGPDGGWTLEVPPGRYRVGLWRPEWLGSLRFLHVQHRPPLAIVPPAETERVALDFSELPSDDCTVRRIRYGAVVDRDFGDMLCAEALHPRMTFVDVWPFEGRAGDRVEVAVGTVDDPSILLAGPDSAVLASARDSYDGDHSTLRAVLHGDGIHYIVVGQDRPHWMYSLPYTLELGLSSGSTTGSGIATLSPLVPSQERARDGSERGAQRDDPAPWMNQS